MVYAYVDIAWDTQSMVLLGVAFAVVNTFASPTAPQPEVASTPQRAQLPPRPPEPAALP
jgi:hypothetical protein